MIRVRNSLAWAGAGLHYVGLEHLPSPGGKIEEGNWNEV